MPKDKEGNCSGGLFSFREKVSADKVYLLDLGGAEINTSKPVKQRSKLGVSLSVVIYIVVLFYIVVTSIQFSKGVPTVIYSSKTPSKFEPTLTPKLGIMFRNSSNGDYYDESIAKVNYVYVTITNQDQLPRVKEPIGSEKCQFLQDPSDKDDDAKILTEKAICPSQQVYMEGTFEMPKYRYLEASVIKCSCTNVSCPIQCTSDEVFNDVFYGGSISVVLEEIVPSNGPLISKFSLVPQVNLATPPTPINSTKSIFWKNLKAFFYNVDIYLRKQVVYNGPRYIFDSHFEYFSYLGTVEPRSDDYNPSSGLLFKCYFRIDAYEDSEIRQSPQLLTLLGSWGGLFSIFMLTVVRAIRYYNRRLYKITEKVTGEINNAIHKMLNLNHHHHKNEPFFQNESPLVSNSNPNNEKIEDNSSPNNNNNNSNNSKPPTSVTIGNNTNSDSDSNGGKLIIGSTSNTSLNTAGTNDIYHHEHDQVEMQVLNRNSLNKKSSNLEISWDLNHNPNLNLNNTSLNSIDESLIDSNNNNSNNNNNNNNNNINNIHEKNI